MIDTGNIKWLAGLLEGEGTFHITSRKAINPEILIRLQMIDQDIVIRAFNVMKLGSITGPFIRKDFKPVWSWSVGKKSEVIQILFTIYPLMGNRRQTQIKNLIEVWQSIPYRKCRKGHDKTGSYCKECSRQRKENKQWDKVLGY